MREALLAVPGTRRRSGKTGQVKKATLIPKKKAASRRKPRAPAEVLRTNRANVLQRRKMHFADTQPVPEREPLDGDTMPEPGVLPDEGKG